MDPDLDPNVFFVLQYTFDLKFHVWTVVEALYH